MSHTLAVQLLEILAISNRHTTPTNCGALSQSARPKYGELLHGILMKFRIGKFYERLYQVSSVLS
jgi:hypothetical protein